MASFSAPKAQPIEVRSYNRPFGWATTQKYALGFVLAILTLLVYSRVHSYPFIDIDDNYYVAENAHVLGPLNWSTVKWAFTHPFVQLYDPLTFFSHNLDVQLFGLDAGQHHDVNVVLHAFNAVLLFWVLKRATGFTGRSFMVAALFAVHPIQVENVAWISERKTILSTVFFLLALGGYRWYTREPRLRRMAVVAFLFGLALLAKPQAITLPFVLLLWDYWPLRRMFAAEPEAWPDTATAEVKPPGSLPQLVKEKIPLFVIYVLDAVLTMAGSAKSPQQYTFAIRLGNAILSYARYVGKAFYPAHLALMYLHPGNSLRWTQVGAALLFLVAVSAFVIAQRRHRYLVAGWLWFVGMMVPTIGLVQVDVSALADRYAYLPFVGLFLMVCWGVAEWATQRHLPRGLVTATSVVVLLVLSATTYRQVGYWRGRITLWTHTLDVTDRNWVAEVHLGTAFRQRGQTEEALAHFYRAAEDRPWDASINLNIALIEHQRGNQRQAIPYYEKVLATSPDDPTNVQVLTDMGHAYDDLGDTARAREYYQAALRPRPIPPRPGVNWQGDWWRDLGPFLRERFRERRSGDKSSSQSP